MPFFIGVQGGLGHGKTLTASVLAHVWRAATGGQAKVFANFELRDATLFDRHEVWYDVVDALGSILVWDEAEMQFDRRQWSRNTTMLQLLKMTRKMRAVNLFVTPVISTLDSRLQDLLEIVINVRKIEGYGIYLDIYEYQAKQFGQFGRLIKTNFLPWRKFRQIVKLNLYDTYQMVYPFQMPRTERQQIDFLAELERRHGEALARSRSGVTIEGEVQDGWYTTSNYDSERRAEEERSEEAGVSLS